MDVVCFHNPEDENGYFSNWYLSEFSVGEVGFTSMEQYMMYQKAVCFHDKDIAEQIRKTNNAAQIKALGRKVTGYNDNIWNGVRQIIVYEGLLAKFSQNNCLREYLLGTGNAVLAECAVKDCIWGIGLSMTDIKRFDISQWRGQNLMGYTLMLVRERLKYEKCEWL